VPGCVHVFPDYEGLWESGFGERGNAGLWVALENEFWD